MHEETDEFFIEKKFFFIYIGVVQQFYLYLYVENNLNNPIRLVTTLDDPQTQSRIIQALGRISFRFPTNSRNLVEIRAYDSNTGRQMKINNRNFVTVQPSTSTRRATTLSVSSGGKFLIFCQVFKPSAT